MNSAILENPNLGHAATLGGPSINEQHRQEDDASSTTGAPPKTSAIDLPEQVRPAPALLEAALWVVGHVVIAGLLPFVVLAMWLSLSGSGMGGFQAYALHALLGGQVLGVCLSLCALRFRVGPHWPSAIHLRLPALIPCILAILCLPAVMLIGSGAALLVENLLGIGNAGREIVAEGNALHSLWFCLLAIGVGPAVNEELFFRGFLGRGLVGRYGILVGVLLTSSLFALVHCDIAQGICAFVLGCYLHLAYRATRSLWVPLLLHFLNNAFAIVMVALVNQIGMLEPAASSAPEPELLERVVVLAIAFLLIVGPSALAAWGLYRLRDRQGAVVQVA